MTDTSKEAAWPDLLRSKAKDIRTMKAATFEAFWLDKIADHIDTLSAQLTEAQAEVERWKDRWDAYGLPKTPHRLNLKPGVALIGTSESVEAFKEECARLQSGAVKVKPLEFRDSYSVQRSDSSVGTYFITPYGFDWRAQDYSVVSDDPVAAAQEHHRKAILAAIETTSAENERLKAQAVKVRELEWGVAGREFEAITDCGDYLVRFDDETGHWYASLETGDPDPFIVDPGDVSGVKEAKAAAQADYERRILSAIETTHADEVWNEAIEAASRRAFALGAPRTVNDAILALTKKGDE